MTTHEAEIAEMNERLRERTEGFLARAVADRAEWTRERNRILAELQTMQDWLLSEAGQNRFNVAPYLAQGIGFALGVICESQNAETAAIHRRMGCPEKEEVGI